MNSFCRKLVLVTLLCLANVAYARPTQVHMHVKNTTDANLLANETLIAAGKTVNIKKFNDLTSSGHFTFTVYNQASDKICTLIYTYKTVEGKLNIESYLMKFEDQYTCKLTNEMSMNGRGQIVEQEILAVSKR